MVLTDVCVVFFSRKRVAGKTEISTERSLGPRRRHSTGSDPDAARQKRKRVESSSTLAGKKKEKRKGKAIQQHMTLANEIWFVIL